jgi:hypothetical protein
MRRQLWIRRTDKGYGFAFVPPVDAEVIAIHRDDAVAGVKLAHAEAGIRDAFHERENPLRLERFFGPRTAPAKRMKA